MNSSTTLHSALSTLPSSQRIAVIGAGPMGLAVAYDLSRAGHAVEIFEADDRIGGMSASFDFDGLSIERYYHYVCGPDYPLFDLLKELGIFDKLQWTETKMGFYYEGKLYKWGTPFDLLFFPKAGIITRLRYGLHMLISSKRSNWLKLDKIEVRSWLKKWIGKQGYKIFWESLLHYKFYELKGNISAAWIWSRIKRMALSRKNLFTEKLGYLAGGSEVLLQALQKSIEKNGGKIHLSSPVEKVLIREGKVQGVQVGGQEKEFDQVVSTIPTPLVSPLMPDLPVELANQLNAMQNVAVVCVILKLKEAISQNFWMNINDSTLQIPGIIELSNLEPMTEKIVYVPYYMPQTHVNYTQDDAYFLCDVEQALAKINPQFTPNWVLGSRVFRLTYAQPVCTVGFAEALPAIKTAVAGLYIADTAYCYPEDRSISESVRIGREIAKNIINN